MGVGAGAIGPGISGPVDSGGGGGITKITSDDNSVYVTDESGPIVDLSINPINQASPDSNAVYSAAAIDGQAVSQASLNTGTVNTVAVAQVEPTQSLVSVDYADSADDSTDATVALLTSAGSAAVTITLGANSASFLGPTSGMPTNPGDNPGDYYTDITTPRFWIWNGSAWMAH